MYPFSVSSSSLRLYPVAVCVWRIFLVCIVLSVDRFSLIFVLRDQEHFPTRRRFRFSSVRWRRSAISIPSTFRRLVGKCACALRAASRNEKLRRASCIARFEKQ